MNKILVDPRVHDLAGFWLGDDARVSESAHAARVMSLASDIQQAIENWCEDETRADEARTKGADDGVEYGHPREALDERARD